MLLTRFSRHAKIGAFCCSAAYVHAVLVLFQNRRPRMLQCSILRRAAAWGLGRPYLGREGRINFNRGGYAHPLAVLCRDNATAHCIGFHDRAQLGAGDPEGANARLGGICIAHERNGGFSFADNVTGQVQHGGSPRRRAWRSCLPMYRI
jgi:hypothetical protein